VKRSEGGRCGDQSSQEPNHARRITMTATSAGQGVVTLTAENLHGVPHGEVVVFTRDSDGPGASSILYNTLGLPDTMTDEQFRALDPERLKTDYRADAIWLNGPRRALMDSATAEFLDEGRVSNVGGIPMRTVGRVHVPDLNLFLSAQRPPYTELTVARTTDWVFKQGRDVHELVAPSGAVYVMQSMSRHIDPNLEIEQLPTLGQRLQLSQGWQYRVRTLEEDLVVPARGDAHIVFDEFENNYQRHT
jgi:hypothetical protein